MITNYWKDSNGGGEKTYVMNLVDELKNQGANVSIIFHEGSDVENVLIKGSIFLFPIRAFLALQRIRPDVVHTHSRWYILLPGYMYKKLHKSRLIHNFYTTPDKKPSILIKMTYRFLIKECDFVIYISKYLKRIFSDYYGLRVKNSVIAYSGVRDISVSEDELNTFRTRFNIKSNRIIILGQGLTVHKVKSEGAKLLMLAMKSLINAYPNILLILTRDGPYVNQLRSFAAFHGILDNILFTGDLLNPYVALEACDIYAHITLADSYPISLLEAMSHGKPIIATAVGGIPEIVEDNINGLLVTTNADNIAKSIDHLLRNRDFAIKLGQSAREAMDKNNRWSEKASSYIKLYKGG